jgi:hypothetical protein
MSALEFADPEATIYVAMPAAPDSEAMLCVESEDGRNPVGLFYLLEVGLARKVLHVWTSWRNGRQSTPEEAARAVIYYAQNDAYEPERPIA